MVTKVKRITGGVPSLSGDQGLTGQVLTKLSNAAGDYGWADIPQAVVDRINNTGSTNVVQVSSSGVDRVDFTVAGAIRMSLRETGIESLTAINGSPIANYLNPEDAPALYADMVSPANVNVNKQWTAAKLDEFLNNAISVPQSAPTGSVISFAGQTPPSGWLECNGTGVSINDYADLYAVVGDTFTTPTTAGRFVPISNGTPEPIAAYDIDGTNAYAGYLDNGSPDLMYVRSMSVDHTTENWTTQILADSPGNAASVRFVKVANGEVYVGAYAEDPPYSSLDIAVTVLDQTTGAILRTYTIVEFGGSNNWAARDLTVDVDSLGNLYIYREIGGSPRFSKYDPNGVILWTYDQSAGAYAAYERPDFVFLDEAGGFVYYGQRNPGTGSAVLIKLNSTTGAFVWASTIKANMVLGGMTLLPNGNVYMVGESTSLSTTFTFTIDAATGSDISSTNGNLVETVLSPVGIAGAVGVVKNDLTDEIFVVEEYKDSGALLPSLAFTKLTFSGNAVATSVTFQSLGINIEPVKSKAIIDPDGGVRIQSLLSGGIINRAFVDGFGVPDLRGEFVRGWSNGSSKDPGRAFGSNQEDTFQGHAHGTQGSSFTAATGGNQAGQYVTFGSPNTTSTYTDVGNDTPRVGDETRPQNVALMYIIKT